MITPDLKIPMLASRAAVRLKLQDKELSPEERKRLELEESDCGKVTRLNRKRQPTGVRKATKVERVEKAGASKIKAIQTLLNRSVKWR